MWTRPSSRQTSSQQTSKGESKAPFLPFETRKFENITKALKMIDQFIYDAEYDLALMGCNWALTKLGKFENANQRIPAFVQIIKLKIDLIKTLKDDNYTYSLDEKVIAARKELAENDANSSLPSDSPMPNNP